MYGCPEPHWTRRFIEITLRNDSVFWERKRESEFGESFIYEHTNKELHILGPYSKRLLQLNICAKEDDRGGSYAYWPKGNYCMFKIRNKCPTGLLLRD